MDKLRMSLGRAYDIGADRVATSIRMDLGVSAVVIDVTDAELNFSDQEFATRVLAPAWARLIEERKRVLCR